VKDQLWPTWVDGWHLDALVLISTSGPPLVHRGGTTILAPPQAARLRSPGVPAVWLRPIY
jgi:hypothetical protein